MGCGCGGQAKQEEQYLVTLADGTVQIATGEVQARQMIAKAGGGVMRRAKAGAAA